ncbi:MAG: hypothetical protein E6I53_11210 [Chloroflexi bacterium]|nr:MAG: hypothetical protein E6J08_00205 [Chloroflexota bacterium]TME04604.1 MAG: hypothetical protein E6I71_05705 [Chloroflexota bacterium]TME51150.1 MAG: hypothetical protein E6I53_11210 [Chloroflexota bacterium]
MGRLFAVMLVLGVVVSCQGDTHAVFTPAPSPSPHTAPTVAILQSRDVPTGLNVCVGSGPIDVYLSVLSGANADLAARQSNYWQQLRNNGAIAGAVSVFASDITACKTELGATTNVKAMSSLVFQFRDEGQAERAWESGVFGFAPPPLGQLSPNLIRGSGTGLGPSSFTYDRPSVRLACWRRSVFVAFVVVSNADLNTFHAATAAIDPRLN